MSIARPSAVVWLVLGISLVNSLGIPLGVPNASAQIHERDLDVIQWFDRLPFPKLGDLQFVRVTTGSWRQSENEPPQPQPIVAFLLSEQGDRFSILTLDLKKQTFTKTPANTPLHEQVSFEPRDLLAEAAEQLKELTQPWESRAFRIQDKSSQRVELFTLARACVAHNHDGPAQDLLNAAARLAPEDRSYKKSLYEDLAHLLMWRAIVDFGDPNITRKELLTQLQTLMQHFPENAHAERAQATIALLTTMIAEDEAHSLAKPLSELTLTERANELVFQLRDQNGHQWSQPGWCDVFNDSRGEESPAAKLRAMGYDAVPALIEALDDQRFTRCVGYHRDFYFSHQVLRVSDCAEATLCEIARRSFRSKKPANVKQEVKQWWDDIQKKGEQQVLIDATTLGDDNSVYQAKQLVAKYPHSALAAIRLGTANAQREWLRTQLVELACTLQEPEVTDFLLGQMQRAEGLSTRVAAAHGLLARQRSEPIPAMIKEWQHALQSDKAGDVSGLPKFLAHCHSLDAIQVLADGMPEFPIHLKHALVSEFVEEPESTDKPKATDPKVEAAIEALLVRALTDTEPVLGTYGGVFGTNPRVCDMAAHVLAQRLPNEYRFVPDVPMHRRDIQIRSLQNVWRAQMNLSPLPNLERRAPDPLPSQRVMPWLTKLAEATTDDQRHAAVTKLEQLGLPALAAIQKFTGSLVADHAAQADLSQLAARLASLITEVSIEEHSATADGKVMGLLNKQTGQTLNGRQFVTLLINLVDSLPAGASGVLLTAYRFDDGTGVRLTIRLSPGQAPKDRDQSACGTHEFLEVGMKRLHGSSGSSVYSHAISVDAYDEFIQMLDNALKTAPDQPLLVRAAISLGE